MDQIIPSITTMKRNVYIKSSNKGFTDSTNITLYKFFWSAQKNKRKIAFFIPSNWYDAELNSHTIKLADEVEYKVRKCREECSLQGKQMSFQKNKNRFTPIQDFRKSKFKKKFSYVVRMYSYPKSMITTNNPDAENMLIVIEEFQSFCTCSGWKPWFNIDFSQTPNLKVSPYNTSTHKWLVLLWLIKPPHQGPYLEKENLCTINKQFQADMIGASLA